jgi:hypothetical protein
MRASGSDAGAGVDPDATGMLPCSALRSLADLPTLGPWQTAFPYFSPDRSWLLLQVRGDPDRLLRVELPSGKVTTVAEALNSVQPLASGGPFLLLGTGSSRDEAAVYDGKEVRTVLGDGACRFQASPDGTRLFVVGPCVGEETGFVAIDVATGSVSTVDPRARMATTWNIAVSPNGQWVAYTTGDYKVDNRTIVVANLAGDSYTIASVSGVVLLEFIADDFLVFHTGGEVDYHGDIRGHVPGSGDTSFLVASDFSAGESYQFSPDRTRVLAAKIPVTSDWPVKVQLYSVPLRGGEPQLLVKDWISPGSYITNPFNFDSQGNYVEYMSPREGDSQSYTTWVVDMQGSAPRKLADGTAGLIPGTSSVLIYDTATDGAYRLRVADFATLRDRLSYSSRNQFIYLSPVRGDQALLFSEYDGSTTRARFMSVSHPQPVLLGTWKESDCRGCEFLPLLPDPTECFTVVNTDTAPGPGTRLVLLPQ